MGWLLGIGGFKIFLLKGGYKAYRNEVFRVLNEPRKVVVLGGKTGSGKTEVLNSLKEKGAQVICLETLASHRGSAFGALGMGPQPRNEMFQNLLAEEWMNVNKEQVLFLENESLTIGPILLPPPVFDAIRKSPVVELNLTQEHRTKRIVKEYGQFPVEDLVVNTKKLSKRLGGLKTKLAVEALEQGEKEKWVEEVLHYYDKAYQYGNNSRNNPHAVIDVALSDEVAEIAEKVMAAAKEFTH